MKFLMSALVLISASILNACSMYIDTEYLPYEGKHQIAEGQGGTKKVIEGMDVWVTGEPPRSYKVLGVVNDSRVDHLLVTGAIMSDAVKEARSVGGDALILINSGTKYGRDLNSLQNSFAVIQYVD